jgi:hypothetical protein
LPVSRLLSAPAWFPSAPCALESQYPRPTAGSGVAFVRVAVVQITEVVAWDQVGIEAVGKTAQSPVYPDQHEAPVKPQDRKRPARFHRIPKRYPARHPVYRKGCEDYKATPV